MHDCEWFVGGLAWWWRGGVAATGCGGAGAVTCGLCVAVPAARPCVAATHDCGCFLQSYGGTNTGVIATLCALPIVVVE